MTNKYEYLDEDDDYFDSISDKSVRQGVSIVINANHAKSIKESWDNGKRSREQLKPMLEACRTEEAMIKRKKTRAKTNSKKTDEEKEIVNSKISDTLKDKWNDKDYREMMCNARKDSYKNGEEARSVKFRVIGTNANGDTLVLCGNAEMKANGINPALVSQCISGTRKSHKGYTWRREAL